MDWITTSPDAIRFTDWSNEDQNERKCPDFLISIITLRVLSISSFVILPLLAYLTSPRASIAMATSMMPIVGLSCNAALPLKSPWSRSPQLVIGRPARSGRTPEGSALQTGAPPVPHAAPSPLGPFGHSVPWEWGSVFAVLPGS